ncbi:cysteine desulfurase family protein [Thermopirellula anaerolimosa]
MTASLPIYLDNHSTTRCDPRVVEAMLPYFGELFGNAASTTHSHGALARQAVDDARERIADALKTPSQAIYFTSGATESNNLAIQGFLRRLKNPGHIITTGIEHTSVLEPIAAMRSLGHEVTILPPTQRDSPDAGVISPEAFRDAIRPNTVFASVGLANNEIGVIQPLRQIAEVCRSQGIVLHTDATQAVGKIPVDVRELDVDLVSFSAHKLYGPKGVGVLVVAKRTPPLRLAPVILGGGHERGLRSGTLNVPGIVGLAAAVELCCRDLESESDRLRSLRDRLFNLLKQGLGDEITLNGPSLERPGLRLPGNLNVRFRRVDGETLLLHLPQLAMSSGSACSSATAKPSHVLLALGLSELEARASIRIGLGRFNTEEDIQTAATAIIAAAKTLADTAGNP